MSVCLIVGWLVAKTGSPAPYLLGSLIAAWTLAKLLPENFAYLGIPKWFRTSVILGLSVLIGAAFSPHVMSQLGLWSGTVITMLVTTIIATVAGYTFLSKFRKYDPTLAFLCALPGGQAEVIAVSQDLVKKDYVVAFCHLVRVAVVVCILPLMLAISEGSEGVAASNIAVKQLPSIVDLSALLILQFVAIGAAGYLLAKLLHIPMAHLLGPLVLSSIFHMMGWVEIPRINEFVILAQVTIGAAIGAKIGKTKNSELAVYFFDAVALAAILVSIYTLAAAGMAYFGDISTMKMILAFIPGGIYEATILALIFGFDVAFVAFHHAVRVLIIFLGLPFLIGKLPSNEQQQ